MGDHDQRGGAARRGAAPASRPPRRRGGWWARRAPRRSWSPSSSAASEQRRRSPPDSPSTARSRVTPASSSSTISRVRGSAAHSWSARPASTASRTEWVSTSASRWCRKPIEQPAGRRHPAGVGRLLAASSPRAAWSCRRRCGRRCRSARPRRRRARRRSSSGRTPYAFETRSRLSEVRPSGPPRHSGSRARARRRPARWPRGRRAGRRPAARSATARAWSRGLAQEQHVGPEPDTQPAQRALGLAARDQLAELGSQVERGRLEVVVQRRGRGGRVAGRQRGDDAPRSSRASAGASGNISSKRR